MSNKLEINFGNFGFTAKFNMMGKKGKMYVYIIHNGVFPFDANDEKIIYKIIKLKRIIIASLKI